MTLLGTTCALPSLPAGEDLLVAAADKPFRFPATFTFVVRSFTVLDGIGKGLDPRFDISEIAGEPAVKGPVRFAVCFAIWLLGVEYH